MPKIGVSGRTDWAVVAGSRAGSQPPTLSLGIAVVYIAIVVDLLIATHGSGGDEDQAGANLHDRIAASRQQN